MNITPINTVNTIKYTPLSFKGGAASAPVETTSTINSKSTDTFQNSNEPAQTTTVNKVITSFKKMFAPKQIAGESRKMTDEEVSELIFTRNLLL